MRRTMLKCMVLVGIAGCNKVTDGGNFLILTLACGIMQPDLKSTLWKAEAVIDSQVVGQESVTVPTSTLLPTGQKLNVAAGSVHTVECRVASQTVSPTIYEIDALVSVDSPGSSRETEFGPTTKSLATGQGVAFSITANP